MGAVLSVAAGKGERPRLRNLRVGRKPPFRGTPPQGRCGETSRWLLRPRKGFFGSSSVNRPRVRRRDSSRRSGGCSARPLRPALLPSARLLPQPAAHEGGGGGRRPDDVLLRP